MTVNIKCCRSGHDFRKKPRTGSITSRVHRKNRNRLRASGIPFTRKEPAHD